MKKLTKFQRKILADMRKDYLHKVFTLVLPKK